MLRALGRVILLPIAFLVAAAATLLVIISLGQERIVQAIDRHALGRAADRGRFRSVHAGGATQCRCRPCCRRCCW